MVQKIAILSDLHCHPKRLRHWDSLLHYDAPRTPANKHPIASLLRFIDERSLTADALLVPGDLTNRMHPKGFVAGWQFCTEVAHFLKARLIAATLGNHDVDYLRKMSRNPFRPARKLHERYPVPPGKQKMFWERGYCVLEQGPLRVIVLNSVSQYGNEREVKRGNITEIQLDRLADTLRRLKPKIFQVALMHHHPVQHEILGLGSDDLMRNGENLVSLLLEFKFHVAIHGHKHHPRITYAGGSTNSLPVVAAGSVAATTERGLLSNTRNLFHILELDDQNVTSCGPHGVLQSWEFHLHRGWRGATSTASDVPSLTGFGCHCDLTGLAVQVGQWFDAQVGTTRSGFFEWRNAISGFPQLRYLTPTDLRDFGKHLKASYSIELMPEPPDNPERIGRL